MLRDIGPYGTRTFSDAYSVLGWVLLGVGLVSVGVSWRLVRPISVVRLRFQLFTLEPSLPGKPSAEMDWGVGSRKPHYLELGVGDGGWMCP